VEAVNCHERPRPAQPPEQPRGNGRPAAASGSRPRERGPGLYDWLLGGKDHYAADRAAWQKLVAALLADSPHITALEADLRYPRSLLTMPEVRDVIDLSQPVGVLLVAVLHFLADSDRPHDLVQAITARLAPGSYIALSHVTADHLAPDTAQAAAAAYDGASAPGVTRTRDDIERFLDGLELIPPGITDVTTWRPGRGHGLRAVRPPLFYGGIGRIPPP
jgi:hypothetical protein